MYYRSLWKIQLWRLRQLETSIGRISPLLPPRPKAGWIAEFRTAMRMTSAQLAKRLGLDQSSVSRLEKSEVKNTITLESLERCANGLGCEVRYIFVPKKPLEKLMFSELLQKISDYSKIYASKGNQTTIINSTTTQCTRYRILDLGTRIWDDEEWLNSIIQLEHQ